MTARVSVSIPLTLLEHVTGKFTVYKIEVTVHPTTNAPDRSWKVSKRYSEFLALHEKLQRKFRTEFKQAGIDFPHKKFFGRFKDDFVENRRKSLEHYLKRVVSNPTYAENASLRSFLEIDVNYDERRSARVPKDESPMPSPSSSPKAGRRVDDADSSSSSGATAEASREVFARVIFDFHPRNQMELSLEEGDVVKILSQDDIWLRGENQRSGESGFFPESYVEMMDRPPSEYRRKDKPDEIAPMLPHKPELLETDERRITVLDKLQLLRKSAMQMSSSNSSEFMKEAIFSGLETVDVRGMEASMKAIDKNMCFARALFDFGAESDYELGFMKGDIITVLERDDETGWWQGELNDQIGCFPGSYCKVIDTSKPSSPPVAARTMSSRGGAGGPISPRGGAGGPISPRVGGGDPTSPRMHPTSPRLEKKESRVHFSTSPGGRAMSPPPHEPPQVKPRHATTLPPAAMVAAESQRQAATESSEQELSPASRRREEMARAALVAAQQVRNHSSTTSSRTSDPAAPPGGGGPGRGGPQQRGGLGVGHAAPPGAVRGRPPGSSRGGPPGGLQGGPGPRGTMRGGPSRGFRGAPGPRSMMRGGPSPGPRGGPLRGPRGGGPVRGPRGGPVRGPRGGPVRGPRGAMRGGVGPRGAGGPAHVHQPLPTVVPRARSPDSPGSPPPTATAAPISPVAAVAPATNDEDQWVEVGSQGPVEGRRLYKCIMCECKDMRLDDANKCVNCTHSKRFHRELSVWQK